MMYMKDNPHWWGTASTFERQTVTTGFKITQATGSVAANDLRCCSLLKPSLELIAAQVTADWMMLERAGSLWSAVAAVAADTGDDISKLQAQTPMWVVTEVKCTCKA